jgi:hypothetical protein
MGSLRSLIASHPALLGHASVRDIATHVGVPKPISAIRLENYLSQPINRSSGRLEALTVKAHGLVALHASGLWMFTGHAHEAGFVGNNYALGFVIDFRDDQGNAPGSIHEKKLSGTVDVGGDRDDDFVASGFDQRIADHWEQVRTARIFWNLHASTDPAQVLELVTEGLVSLVALAGVVKAIVALAGLVAGLGLTISPSAHVNSDGDKEGVIEVQGTFP